MNTAYHKFLVFLGIVFFIVAFSISECQERKNNKQFLEYYKNNNVIVAGKVFLKKYDTHGHGTIYLNSIKSNVTSFDKKLGYGSYPLIIKKGIANYYTSDYSEIEIGDSLVINQKSVWMAIYRKDSCILKSRLMTKDY